MTGDTGATRRRESIVVLLSGLGLALLVSVPYFLGHHLDAPDWQFSGFIIGVEDGNSYLAKMLQGAQGAWSFHLPYTPEAHEGGPFYLLYILLGKVAHLTGLPQILVLDLSRVLAVTLAVYAFYQLATYLVARPRVALLATGLFAFGGGLGWLWILAGRPSGLGDMPVDLWVPDASFFLSALTYPHLTLKQALLFWFILGTLRFLRDGEWRDAACAVAAGLGTSLIHPYALPIVGVPLGIHAIWQARKASGTLWRHGLRLSAVFAPSLLYMLYSYWAIQRNPIFRIWQTQLHLSSPGIHLYLLGFGIPVLLAAVAAIVALRHHRERLVHPFAWIWLLALPPLVYLPIIIQRRFLDGYQAPLAILAAVGLDTLRERIPLPPARPFFMAAVALPISITSVFLLVGASVSVSAPAEPIYRAAPEMAAVRWFWSDPTYPVVLSSFATGNVLPAHAPVRAFVGHGPETIDSGGKVALVRKFFDTETEEAWRQSLLAEYGVKYIFHGPHERALGGFDPAHAPYLEAVQANDSVCIYRVLPGSGPHLP